MTDGSAGDSRRTVVVALAINLLIALAKATAAALTGSSALLAEAGHSVADAGNELFLLVALNRSGRPADEMELVLAEVKENDIADDITIGRARNELLRLADFKSREAVDTQV